MQSICNQLLHESAEGRRDLWYLKFIWIERDPVLIAETDFGEHKSQPAVARWVPPMQNFTENPGCITSQLLASFAPGETTDKELEEQYAEEDYSTCCDAHDIENPKTANPNKRSPSSTRSHSTSSSDVLDVQIYLTGNAPPSSIPELPAGVRWGRPNIHELFLEMKQEAMDLGETKVAVCVSAPRKLMHLARQACVLYSDDDVRFDIHLESMAF